MENNREATRDLTSGSATMAVTEMNVALALDNHFGAISELGLEPDDRFTSIMRQVCGLFVTVVDSKVHLIHQTARGFLLQGNGAFTSGFAPLYPELKLPLSMKQAHITVYRMCVIYLTSEEIEPIDVPPMMRKKEMKELLEANHLAFHDYAALNWDFHYYRQPTTETVRAEKENVEVYHNGIVKRIQPRFRGPAQSATMATLILLRLYGVALTILSQTDRDRMQLDDRGSSKETPICLAARTGQEDFVRLLIAFGARVNATDSLGWTPLSLAAQAGRVQIVRLLLEHSAATPATRVSGRRLCFDHAFHRSVANGGQILALLYHRDPNLAGILETELEFSSPRLCRDTMLIRGTTWKPIPYPLPTPAREEHTDGINTEFPFATNFCDDCRRSITIDETSFYCPTSHDGDFDLCWLCVEGGSWCAVQDHGMCRLAGEFAAKTRETLCRHPLVERMALARAFQLKVYPKPVLP